MFRRPRNAPILRSLRVFPFRPSVTQAPPAHGTNTPKKAWASMTTQTTKTEIEESTERAEVRETSERCVAVAQLTNDIHNELSTLVNAIYLLRSEPLSNTAADLLDAAEGAIIRLAHISKKLEEQAR